MAHSAHDHAHDHAAAPAHGPRVVSISDKNPKVRTVALDRVPMGAEATFIPAILKGLGVTMRHFWRNVFTRTDTETIEYPEEKVQYPPRYRGLHRLMHREDGSVRCVACMMCPTVCPAHCITIHAGEREDSNEKFPVIFEIDELRCVVCGFCVEACPCDAIRMDSGIHMSPVDFRGNAVLGKTDLMKRGAPSTAVQGGVGANWRERDPAPEERGPGTKVPAAPR